MSANHIPGYYYDEEKKKYFRIQKNHTLPSSANVHTHESVKAVSDEKRHWKEAQAKRQKLEHDTVKLASLRKDDSFCLLSHRLGNRPKGSFQNTAAQMYARGLSSRPAVREIIDDTLTEVRPLDNGTFGHTFHITDSGRITLVRAGNRLSHLRPASAWYPGRYAYVDVAPIKRAEAVNDLRGEPRFWDRERLLSDAVRSMISFEAGGYMRVVACADLPLSILHPMGVPYTDASRGPPLESFLYRAVQPRPTYVWSLACSDVGKSYAMATDTGLVLSSSFADGPSIQLKSVPGLRNREQMTVEYKDPNTVMSGERSGRVNFTDCRAALDTVGRLLHSSAATGIKVAKHPEQVIVQGFSTLSLYDLRFVTKSVGHGTKTNEHSNSYINFAVPDDRHSDRYITGGKSLAYSYELDLVVAASSHSNPAAGITKDKLKNGSWRHLYGNNRVSLYSGATGKLLSGPLTDHRFVRGVTGIDMKRLRDGPESIITLSNGDLLEWTLHTDDDDDHIIDDTEHSEEILETWRSKNLHAPPGELPPRDTSDLATQDMKSMAELWRKGNLGP